MITSAAERKLTPVMVTMKLDTKYGRDLKKDSKASLSTVGVLGDTVVDINSQYAVGPPLDSGDEVKTLETPNLQDVVKASQGTIESLNVILAKMNTIVDNLQSGKGSVGQLINNPDLYNKANATVDELHKLAQNLNTGKGTVGKLMNDDALYNRINDTIGRVDSITAGLQNGQGSAGKLLKDEQLYTNLNNHDRTGEPAADRRERGQGRAWAVGEGSAVPAAAAGHTDAGEYAGDGHRPRPRDIRQAGDRRPGVHEPEQTTDAEHAAGGYDPVRPEEVPDDSSEDLLGYGSSRRWPHRGAADFGAWDTISTMATATMLSIDKYLRTSYGRTASMLTASYGAGTWASGSMPECMASGRLVWRARAGMGSRGQHGAAGYRSLRIVCGCRIWWCFGRGRSRMCCGIRRC